MSGVGAAAAQSNLNIPRAVGPAVHSRVAKVGLYRECLLLARTIQNPRTRAMSVAEVRDKWRENRGAGGQSLELLLASTLDRMAYVRLCTSKARLKSLPLASVEYNWDVKNPMESHEKLAVVNRAENGKRAEHLAEAHGRGKRDFVPITNWGQGNIDPDLIKKQKQQLDHSHFMGPAWRGKPKPLIYEDLSFEEQLAAHVTPAPKLPKKIKKHF